MYSAETAAGPFRPAVSQRAKSSDMFRHPSGSRTKPDHHGQSPKRKKTGSCATRLVTSGQVSGTPLPPTTDESVIVEMATSPCAGNDKPVAQEAGLRGAHLGCIAQTIKGFFASFAGVLKGTNIATGSAGFTWNIGAVARTGKT